MPKPSNEIWQMRGRSGFTLVEALSALFIALLLLFFAVAAQRCSTLLTERGEALLFAERERAAALAQLLEGSEENLTILSRNTVTTAGVKIDVLNILTSSGKSVNVFIPR